MKAHIAMTLAQLRVPKPFNPTRRKQWNNASGLTGVSYYAGQGNYVVKVQADRKTRILGRFVERWDAYCCKMSFLARL